MTIDNHIFELTAAVLFGGTARDKVCMHLMIFYDNLKINNYSLLPKNLCCGYLLELPRRGDSKEYTQHRLL